MLQLWIFKSFWFVSHVKTWKKKSILLCHTSLFKNNCVRFYSCIIISPLIKGQHAARYQFNNPPCTPRRLSVWWMALPKPRELRVGCAEIKAMVLTTKTQKPRSVLGSGGGASVLHSLDPCTPVKSCGASVCARNRSSPCLSVIHLQLSVICSLPL